MTFQLDTSGAVKRCRLSVTKPHRWLATDNLPAITWPDLPPFTQDYIEALLRDYHDKRSREGEGFVPVSARFFKYLAPVTLARSMADCEAVIAEGYCGPGSEFWRIRQLGKWLNRPPLTPDHGDDGLIYLREAGQ